MKLLLGLFFFVPGVSLAAMPNCAPDLLTTPIALALPERQPDGRLRVTIDYSDQNPGVRHLEIPAVINELVGVKNLRLVVLAGNVGHPYDFTRHSLAHRFGDYLIENVPAILHSTDPNYVRRETIPVTYDDRTKRDWTWDFKTEVPRFRTPTGEAFYFPDVEGVPILALKMLGDYNEVGDYAIVIRHLLNLPLAQILLVRDDLDMDQGTLGFRSDVIEQTGNNAERSLIRNLAYEIFDPLLARLRDEWELNPEESQILLERWRAEANVRGGYSFRNVNSIAEALIKPLHEVLGQRLRDHIDRLQQEFKVVKAPMGLVMKELKDPSTSDARKQELETQRQSIFEITAPLATEIKGLEAKLKDLKKTLQPAFLREFIIPYVTFTRLGIGTKLGEIAPADRAEFVLSDYARDVFNEDLWKLTLEQLRIWLREPIASL